MNNLKPFGFPLILGQVKRRLAKKIINRRGRDMLKRFHKLQALKVGDLVSDCSGYNDKIVSVEPEYRSTKHGEVLVDLDFRLEHNSCDMYHCGVDLPMSYEEAKKQLEAFKAKDPTAWWSKVILNLDGTYTSPETK